MFGSSFYPTPGHVAQLMFEPYVKSIKGRNGAPPISFISVGKTLALEPQAGKGNLCDYLVDNFRFKKSRILTIEADPDLRSILIGKKYKVIDSDFLEYRGDYYFDFIPMNPPFDKGVDHALKAWEILGDDGHMVCLLNSETIRNPYSKKREMLVRIIQEYGYGDKCKDVGKVFFEDAERKTSVECSIIWLHKPKKVSEYDLSDLDLDKESRPIETNFNPIGGLAPRNMFQSLEQQYLALKKIIFEQHELEKQERYYLQGIKNKKYEAEQANQSLNEKLDELKVMFWQHLFEQTQLGRKTTTDFQNQFEKHTANFQDLAFTRRNIEEVLMFFMDNVDEMMDKAIKKAFETFTSWNAKNVIHTEGWKTNKSWRVNEKLIVPNGCREGYRVGHYQEKNFMDLDRVLCFLSGKDIDKIETIVEAMTTHRDKVYAHERDYDVRFASTFFIIKVHKKGTVHLWFKDKSLMQNLNIAAAKGKNWVGDGI